VATSLVFLTPVGGLLALGVVLPVVAFLVVRRRARSVRSALGLTEPRRRRILVALGAVIAAGALLGVAAAQPVVEQTTTLRTRTDAEAWIVLDVSRSMLAQRSPDSRTRFERAKAAAGALRSSLGDIRVGIASLTDRALPHLFPSDDEGVFQATLDRSLGIERPPPGSSLTTLATKLDALATLRTHRFFAPTARRRLILVLTDGETQPVASARLGSLMRQRPAIESVFVQFWHADERVFIRGAPEPLYHPDPSARSLLERVAESVGGSVYGEGDVSAASQKARELIGTGPTIVRGERGGRIPLAPYLAAAALAPLGLLIRRRDR
jgi:hypothetical protein